jgi:hypothetical protein
MTPTIVCIVEGDGEVRAIPVLLRRLAEAKGVYTLNVPPPIRVHRDQFLRREEEFRRKLLLAAAKAQGGAVLVVLDADDDCPMTLAQDVTARAAEFARGVSLHVVIANREYEAWLLAGASSLAGRRGLRDDLDTPPNPDEIRNAKGWLSERMPTGRYHEVSDQPAFTAAFDLNAARENSRSFRKLAKTVNHLIEIEAGQ